MIARMGHPILLSRADDVLTVQDPAIQADIKTLEEAFVAAGGVGLAAPQCFISRRMFMIEVTEAIANRRQVAPFPRTLFINPVMEVLDETLWTAFEACLSIPGMMGKVPRFKRIRYQAMNAAGKEIAGELADYHARIFQHELDHLNGILYPMRMSDLKEFGFVEEFT